MRQGQALHDGPNACGLIIPSQAGGHEPLHKFLLISRAAFRALSISRVSSSGSGNIAGMSNLLATGPKCRANRLGYTRLGRAKLVDSTKSDWRELAPYKQDPMDVKQVVILGHSILRNLKHYASTTKNRDPTFFWDQVRVSWLVKGGLSYKRLQKHFKAEIEQILPDIIYMQVAENDVNSRWSATKIGRKYWNLAKSWVDGLGVGIIILSIVTPREKPTVITKKAYQKKAFKVNTFWKDRVLVNNKFPKGQVVLQHYKDPRIWLWGQERLANHPSFKSDGVHFKGASMKRLYFNLQRALKAALPAV